jgi:hypothetical protein
MNLQDFSLGIRFCINRALTPFRMAQRKRNECIAASPNPCAVVQIVIKIKPICDMMSSAGRKHYDYHEPMRRSCWACPDELALCAVPSARHKSLLSSYLFNLERGENTVCRMIIGDFWGLMELGAQEQAADALLVLRLFLSDYPNGKCAA